MTIIRSNHRYVLACYFSKKIILNFIFHWVLTSSLGGKYLSQHSICNPNLQSICKYYFIKSNFGNSSCSRDTQNFLQFFNSCRLHFFLTIFFVHCDYEFISEGHLIFTPSTVAFINSGDPSWRLPSTANTIFYSTVSSAGGITSIPSQNWVFHWSSYRSSIGANSNKKDSALN